MADYTGTGNTGSIISSNIDSLGPCRIYWDVDSNGSNGLDLGPTQGAKLMFKEVKAPTNNDQYGSEPSNMITTGDSCMLEATFTQATLQRLAATTPGFSLERNTGGDIVSFTFGSSIGNSDQEIGRQMKIVPLIGGAETTDTLRILHIWRASPLAEIETTFDVSTQRVTKLTFNAYRDEGRLDALGRATYFGGGDISTITSEDDDEVTINAVSPNSVTFGANFVLTGANFASTVAGNTVTLGGVSATVVRVNTLQTKLTVQCPASGVEAGNDVPIVVTVAGNTANATIDVTAT